MQANTEVTLYYADKTIHEMWSEYQAFVASLLFFHKKLPRQSHNSLQNNLGVSCC